MRLLRFSQINMNTIKISGYVFLLLWRAEKQLASQKFKSRGAKTSYTERIAVGSAPAKAIEIVEEKLRKRGYTVDCQNGFITVTAVN